MSNANGLEIERVLRTLVQEARALKADVVALEARRKDIDIEAARLRERADNLEAQVQALTDG